MDDDGGVPGQKRSLEPNDDESAAPVTDGDRKKLKTDDCQFCSFDNKLPKLKDPQQWSSLPSVVHEVLAMIWSRKKRLDPDHDGAEKQQQHRVNRFRLIIHYLGVRVMPLPRLILVAYLPSLLVPTCHPP